ncbi:MAG: MerR family transcriptional regulator [bacterium]
MKELLTLKEIAHQLGSPESNLRYYRNRIGDYLPSAGKGRKRRYYPEAVEIFRRTVDLVSEGMSLDRVYRHLASEKPVELESGDAISQQELIEKISEKIAQKIAGAGIGASSVQGGGEAGQLAASQERISELEALLREQGRAEERAARWESEAARLKPELDAALAERNELRELIKEKEKIVELQKTQLIEARNKRMNIEEELAGIRAALDKLASAGG